MVAKVPYFETVRVELVAARTVALLLLLLCATCNRTSAPATPLPVVTGLNATLEDEVRDLPNGQIAWSTYWKLCWDAYQDAASYQLQSLTGEGSARRVLRQTERCFRLQAAAGENSRAQGLLNRDLQLALQQGQLAYRVRAVRQDGRLSEWSAPLAVGKATPR
jgi:hypothetical protein